MTLSQRKSHPSKYRSALDIGAKQSNQDIREAAGELLAQVAIQVADCDEEYEESKQITRDIIDMMTKVWNDESEHSVKIEPTVKAGKFCRFAQKLIGVFSRNFVKGNQKSYGRGYFEGVP